MVYTLVEKGKITTNNEIIVLILFIYLMCSEGMNDTHLYEIHTVPVKRRRHGRIDSFLLNME